MKPIRIEKGIARPKPARGRKPTFEQFRTMGVDDSFFVARIRPDQMSSYIYYQNKHGNGKRFEQHKWKQDGVPGVRVWRVK